MREESFAGELWRGTVEPHGRFDVGLAIHEVGVAAVGVVALVAAFVGTNVALAGADIFSQFGRTSDVGIFVALAGIREMVPVTTAFMLAAKSGAAMAALVATIRLGGQLSALTAMGVDPVRYLAVPRILATVLSAPLLVVFANVICLGTGWAVAVHQLGVEGALYWEGVSQYLAPADLGIGVLKGIVFGLLIGVVSLFHGFRSEASPAGVGQAANHAVVSSAVGCIVLNYAMTELFY